MVQSAFDRAIAKRQEQENQPKVTVSWHVFNALEQEFPSLSDLTSGKFQGVFITGSVDNAYGDESYKLAMVQFIQSLVISEGTFMLPLVGICFGHQIISRACGNPSQKNPNGWELGPTAIQLTEIGRHVLRTDKDIITLNEFHEDHVATVPPGFFNLATTSPHTAVQAMVSADGNCLTLQGHPEINNHTVHTVIHKLSDTLPPDLVKSALLQLASDPALDDVWLTDRLLSHFTGSLPRPFVT
ncbi:class I glutamine amidotransferase-like protein [Hesseltinella vesiculosa]|uniref:Class I glutamine amidotransferase-like protein n=1 Tax=Hesseltinella vesiculosa TaxID=101127 RepID=A0A1X2GGJ3_9FUNG|nr:class I glutamine amidotransferase-like protein [Hesseltinella vesiculosa]